MPYRIFLGAAIVSLVVFLVIAGTRVFASVVCQRDYPAVPLGQVWEDSGTHWILRWPVLLGTAGLPSIWLLSVLVRDVMGSERDCSSTMPRPPCSGALAEDLHKQTVQERN
jgi:hypothetical protein